MEIDEKKEEQIVNFGVFGYESQKMANILSVDEDIITSEMKNSQSKYRKTYQKGKDLADYVIDLKLFDMAKDGDINALEKFESRKRKRENDKKNK